MSDRMKVEFGCPVLNLGLPAPQDEAEAQSQHLAGAMARLLERSERTALERQHRKFARRRKNKEGAA
jgi:hypothetical protein